MNTAIGFIVILGVLIFVHEFGHFIVAKLSGVEVEIFSLGFGPRLFGFRWKGTDYRISLIPLGGYVKMLGEEPGSYTGDDPSAFVNKPVGIRTAIVSAGPLMNLVTALVLLPLAYMVGVKVPAYLEKKPVVGFVEKNSLAFKNGFREGDTIVAVNGEEVHNWGDLANRVSMLAGREAEFTVMRGGKILAIKLHLPSPVDLYTLGLYPYRPPVIGKVLKDSPAEKAGLKDGDRIVEINGVKIASWYDIGKIIRESRGSIIVVVKRGGKILRFRVIPEVEKGRRIIGILAPSEMVLKRYSFTQAVRRGIQKNIEMFILTFKIIGKLVTGKLSLKVLGGPIQIAVVSGEAVKKGLGELLLLMAFISLQLGILNLLPIPVLDGGYLLFFLIEAIRGRPLPEKVINISLQIGFIFLILLTLAVTKNDIKRVWGKHTHQTTQSVKSTGK